MDNSDIKNHAHLDSDGFFCNLPSSSYARFVLSSVSGNEDLWSMEGILAQCHIDAALRANAHFPSLCQTCNPESSSKRKCCRSWSPANYIALLSNRTSCLGVNENDLGRVKTLLKRCAHFYHNLQLTPDCADDLDCQRRVPADCYLHNAAYHLLHYLLDIEFIPSYVRIPLRIIFQIFLLFYTCTLLDSIPSFVSCTCLSLFRMGARR